MTGRRLAALLMADVVGYSRLVGTDESGTIDRVRSLRQDLLEPAIAQKSGRLVKIIGDGFLAEFPSIVDATACAIDIQEKMAGPCAGSPVGEPLRLRIGVHVGDLVIEGDDLLGDGVNIVSRLEGVADPGGVVLSADAHRHVQGKLPYRFDDRGEQSFKNIAQPIRIFSWSPVGVRARSGVAGSGHSIAPSISAVPVPRLSLVVLPFQNLSEDPQQEYFSDCVTEDLTIDLSRLSGTVVIALSTAFSYKNKPIDARQVGRELGVRYVLEGAVRRHPDGVSVKVELVDATNAATIWAERFDIDPASLHRLQSEVTGRIAYALDAQLVLAETTRALEDGPGDLKAEDLIFRGRAIINKTPNADDCVEARRLFELALQLNGQSADGFAYLAQTYMWDWLMGWTTEKDAILELAELNAQRALAIDARNVRAHWVQGAVYDQRRQFDQAIAAFDTALAYDPNSARSYSRRGYCKLMAGRPEDAVTDLERAIRLSPRDQHLGSWYWYTGLAHRWLGQHEQALAFFVRSVDANRRAHVFYPYLAAEYVAAGRLSEAQAIVAEYRKLQPAASIQYLRNRWDYRSEHPRYLAMMEEQLEALRQAGLPESAAACEA